MFFRDDDDDDTGSTSVSDHEEPYISCAANGSPPTLSESEISIIPVIDNIVDPEPHISSQFYTFNRQSHALMSLCIIEGRVATPEEIRLATPHPVLSSWRSVWKDRNEDTAYLTAWKRIQDKLSVHVDLEGNQFLCFKNNSQQFVSHVNQWQDIVTGFHCDADLKHLGFKETVERIKQVWTVGAKFYGIPESFVRVCVDCCSVCSGSIGSGARTKRRKFEYTESIDVPAKDVSHKLQQLAAKHKVVLCIRQKYIRYKPFMAEVKDYACHRAGEPAVKKSKILKREPYASKRCGCGFRIRAIVPITNYNERDKTFIYEEEGMAVFKLYAVHSGHEPGPLDGNARIMHRLLGYRGFLMDQDAEIEISKDVDNGNFDIMGKTGQDLHVSVMQQVQELRNEVAFLDDKLNKIPHEMLYLVSRDLSDILSRVRHMGEGYSRPVALFSVDHQSDDILVREHDLPDWSDNNHERMYTDDITFGRSLGDITSWDQMANGCRNQKSLMNPGCKSEKWMECNEFDDKNILDCEEAKLTKPVQHDGAVVAHVGLVGIQVDNFYADNPKWYDLPCGLDSETDCGDSGFQNCEVP